MERQSVPGSFRICLDGIVVVHWRGNCRTQHGLEVALVRRGVDRVVCRIGLWRLCQRNIPDVLSCGTTHPGKARLGTPIRTLSAKHQ